MTNPSIPDYLLERIRHGELSAELGPVEKARLAELEDSDRALLEALPPARFAAQLERKLGAERATRRSRWQWPALAAVAAAAGAVFLAVPQPVPAPDGRLPEETRVKGEALRLWAYRLVGDEVRELSPTARARPGDRLQLRLRAPAGSFVVLVSLDGRGTTTVHFPLAQPFAERVADGGQRSLDRSFVLDDAPGFERFFLVSAPVRFPVQQVEDAVRVLASSQSAAGRLGALPLAEPFSVTSLLVEKESP